jgi:hypothetical protein
MGLQYRPMRPKDVDGCVSIIAEHPVIGPRYGRAISDLRKAWLRLLDWEAKRAGVVEEVNGSHATICVVGVSVFVTDDFVREIKSRPLRWIGPELAKRIVRENSPLLSDRQVREANSSGGMNLVVWEGCIAPEFEQHTEVHRKMMGLFLDNHRGYLWKEAIASQSENVERFEWTLKTGGLLWNPAQGRYVEHVTGDPREIFREPHIVGVTREIERGRPGSWVGALFDYHPPQIGFSRGEQKLLLSALSGGTDKHVRGDLGASLSTVKNTWRSIYNRTALRLPELFLDHSKTDVRSSERGKEKKRHLLAYLREHPEELRPVSRRLLRQAAAQQGVSRKYRRA